MGSSVEPHKIIVLILVGDDVFILKERSTFVLERKTISDKKKKQEKRYNSFIIGEKLNNIKEN